MNRLALILVPKIPIQFYGNVLPACVPGTFCFGFFRTPWGCRMLPLVFTCTATEEGGFSEGAPKPGGRLQVARPPAAAEALRAAGTVLRSGCWKGTLESADEARSPGGHALPQARSCSPGVFKTHSFAEHFLVSCLAASCLSPLFTANPFLLPALTLSATPAAAAAELGARRLGRASCREPAGPGTRARPRLALGSAREARAPCACSECAHVAAKCPGGWWWSGGATASREVSGAGG